MKKIHSISIIIFFIYTFGIRAEEKVEPVPDPPSLRQLVDKSDLIIRGKLLRNRKYQIGNRQKGQSRILCLAVLRGSKYYPILPKEQFTVTYRLKPGVLGPHFSSVPETGEYIFFLNIKNVELRGIIVGYLTHFIQPNPFALQEMERGLEREIRGLIK